MIHFPKTAYPKNWLYPVAEETNSPLKNMRFYLFHLPANQTSSFVFEQGETVFVLLSGQARAWIGGNPSGRNGLSRKRLQRAGILFLFLFRTNSSQTKRRHFRAFTKNHFIPQEAES